MEPSLLQTRTQTTHSRDVAETTLEVFFAASQSLLQPEADKLKNELHDLDMILSNAHTEFKKAIAELKKEIIDKISSAVIERVTDMVHNSAEDVAGAAACESFYIGEIGPGEEEHCNNTGNKLSGTRKPMTFLLYLKIPNVSVDWDMLLRFGPRPSNAHADYAFERSATSGDSYEVVYSNQKHMTLYSLNAAF